MLTKQSFVQDAPRCLTAVVTFQVSTTDQIVAECADACNSDDEVEEEGEQLPETTFTPAVATQDSLRKHVRSSDNPESHTALQILEKHFVLYQT